MLWNVVNFVLLIFTTIQAELPEIGAGFTDSLDTTCNEGLVSYNSVQNCSRGIEPVVDGRACSIAEWTVMSDGTEDDGTCSMCETGSCQRCPRWERCPSGSLVFFSREPHLASQSDILVFAINAKFVRKSQPRHRREGQAIVSLCSESSHYYPYISNLREEFPTFGFDLTLGYSRAYFDMHSTFVPHNLMEMLLRPHRERFPTKLACAFISNCHGDTRNIWMSRMMSVMQIDSFGSCNNNKEIPATLQELNRDPRKRIQVKNEIMKDYFFVLAFENSVEYDWVTEKVYDALEIGVVPVYLGAPNWRDYFPSGGVVDASYFDSPEELAGHLVAVAKDPIQYSQLLNWKGKKDAFDGLITGETSYRWNLCRLCDWYHDDFKTRASHNEL